MAPTNNASFSFILLVVVMLWSCTYVFGDSLISGFFNTKIHVYVENALGPDNMLTLHCKSKDNDLGEHNVPFNTSYEWKFGNHFFKETLFWCRVWWYDHHKLAKWDGIYYVKKDNSLVWKYGWTR
ncbi:hypothetical protein AQUCO_02500007v1 [Aquilegia coerulea]|uniref:S-protein homolog n=1 Tax=Aquilegia coerulea TaxID=218851 RepID=A0A2G5D920_AQUCA|nr:hypothetical protein AQUCO_02500007v1 [Aquilegia coerulea]